MCSRMCRIVAEFILLLFGGWRQFRSGLGVRGWEEGIPRWTYSCDREGRSGGRQEVGRFCRQVAASPFHLPAFEVRESRGGGRLIFPSSSFILPTRLHANDGVGDGDRCVYIRSFDGGTSFFEFITKGESVIRTAQNNVSSYSCTCTPHDPLEKQLDGPLRSRHVAYEFTHENEPCEEMCGTENAESERGKLNLHHLRGG